MTDVASQQIPASSRAAPRSARGMRVLMGVPAPGATHGGPALHLPMLVEDLRSASGIDVRTFSYGRKSEGESTWTKVVTQLQSLLSYPALVLRHKPDLVHLNSALDRNALLRDLPFALATKLLRRPLFIKWHGAELELLESRSPIWRGMSQLLLRLVSGLGVLSEQERAALADSPLAARSWAVKNGLELQRYAGRTDVRARHGIPREAPVLLFIARLIPTKGLQDTLRAFHALPHDAAPDTPAHLVVVGDGPERAPAEALVRQLQIDSRVHFAGTLSETAALEYYRGADILVFPTFHAEGFPMSIFQSVASGLGIITTRIRAARDHLTAPQHCLFVTPRDVDDIRDAIERLLRDSVLLAQMQQNNRELAARFDRKTIAKEFAEIYAELLK